MLIPFFVVITLTKGACPVDMLSHRIPVPSGTTSPDMDTYF